MRTSVAQSCDSGVFRFLDSGVSVTHSTHERLATIVNWAFILQGRVLGMLTQAHRGTLTSSVITSPCWPRSYFTTWHLWTGKKTLGSPTESFKNSLADGPAVSWVPVAALLPDILLPVFSPSHGSDSGWLQFKTVCQSNCFQVRS